MPKKKVVPVELSKRAKNKLAHQAELNRLKKKMRSRFPSSGDEYQSASNWSLGDEDWLSASEESVSGEYGSPALRRHRNRRQRFNTPIIRSVSDDDFASTSNWSFGDEDWLSASEGSVFGDYGSTASKRSFGDEDWLSASEESVFGDYGSPALRRHRNRRQRFNTPIIRSVSDDDFASTSNRSFGDNDWLSASERSVSGEYGSTALKRHRNRRQRFNTPIIRSVSDGDFASTSNWSFGDEDRLSASEESVFHDAEGYQQSVIKPRKRAKKRGRTYSPIKRSVGHEKIRSPLLTKGGFYYGGFSKDMDSSDYDSCADIPDDLMKKILERNKKTLEESTLMSKSDPVLLKKKYQKKKAAPKLVRPTYSIQPTKRESANRKILIYGERPKATSSKLKKDDEDKEKKRAARVDAKLKEIRNVFEARQGAVYDVNKIYNWYKMEPPATNDMRAKEEEFITQFRNWHFKNPGSYDTVGGLSKFRERMAKERNLKKVLATFKYTDFLRTFVPTQYDKPDYTGPFIAGRFSEDLRELYKKYNVKENEWDDFLEDMQDREDVPIYDRELAKYINNRIRATNAETFSKEPEIRRNMIRRIFEALPLDLKNLKEIYDSLATNRLLNKELLNFRPKQDKYFMRRLNEYREEHPGPFDTMRAYRYYRRMDSKDPGYFSNTKFFRFKNFRIWPIGAGTFEKDFTGVLIAGPYHHELKDLYQRYGVKENWKEFLEKLKDDPDVPFFDSELARHILNKVALYYQRQAKRQKEVEEITKRNKERRKNFDYNIPEIEEIKKEFYARATPRDLNMIKLLRMREEFENADDYSFEP